MAVAWGFGWHTGATSWLVWTDLAAAVVILAGLGPAATEELSGMATWPFAGLILVAAWMFGLALHATPWLTWLNLALGCAFLLLTVGFTLASRDGIVFPHGGNRVHG